MKKIIITLIILSILNISCKKNVNYICVASVMSDIIINIVNELKKEGFEFKVNVASSGVCAKQIENGFDASIFFSANKKWIDHLVEKKRIIKETVKPVLSDKLVCIVSKDKKNIPKNISELSKINNIKIVCSNYKFSPAGKYFKKACDKMKVWENINGNIVMTSNVRITLMNIEKNIANIGIVYKNMAVRSKVKIAFEIPENLTGKIVFYSGIIKGYEHNKKVNNLMELIFSEKGRKIAEKYGYDMINNYKNSK